MCVKTDIHNEGHYGIREETIMAFFAFFGKNQSHMCFSR